MLPITKLHICVTCSSQVFQGKEMVIKIRKKVNCLKPLH